jgi:predicted nuclease of restriction endonuclease-like (RecB) superfamily
MNAPTTKSLLNDLRDLILQARRDVARSVNSSLVLLYWKVGERIRKEILQEKRAAYGKEIVSTLSSQLMPEFGEGFGVRNLFRMIRFAEVFRDEQIVSTLSSQLGWSHFVQIIPLKDDLQREFYAAMSRIEGWSVRQLREKIGGMLFERTALSKKPAELIKQEIAAAREQDRITPDLVFRDPYFLNFLGLRDTFSERDLEEAILRDLESFILEIGIGFSFVARQKRITVDGEDYYLDLLFYHRKLRRLVAIELKLGKFKASDKGQMELYLRWLNKYERQSGEESPIGLILCADKSDEHVELLQLGKSGIRVAAYMTDLPPRRLLEEKLHNAIAMAKGRLERDENGK